jgi:phosphatidylglycerol---prolipoprotein diacylglyceryl transferase
MRRVLFELNGIKIYSYPAMLYLGLNLGMMAENFATNAAHLNTLSVFIATILLLIPALVGARLLHVITHWSIYRRAPERIWRQGEGGAAMYGAVPFMLIASVPLLSAFRIPFGAFWDVATLPILVGMIFTRIGCLLNGCCSGRTSNSLFAMYLPDHKGIWQRRIPTQLLEAGWGVLLLVAVIFLWNFSPFPGAIFLCVLVGYSLGRFVFEWTRQEQDRMGKLTVHQTISFILVLIPLILLVKLD